MGISATGLVMVLVGGLALAACLGAILQARAPRKRQGLAVRQVAGREMPIQSFYASGGMNAMPEVTESFHVPAEGIDDLSIAASLTAGAVGTAVATIALDTESVGLDPQDKRLKARLTELVDVLRPAAVSDLFVGASDSLPEDDALVETRRAVIKAYRNSGRGACLVVPVTGAPGMFFDLRIERYSQELAGVCSEVFDILGEIIDWSHETESTQSTPVRYAALPQTVPDLLRSLRVAVRDLELPPSFDYIRGEIDAYAQTLSGRVEPRTVLQTIAKFGRLDLAAVGMDETSPVPTRLLCLMSLIAVWDALILNFGFSEDVTR